MKKPTDEELENRFRYHPPGGDLRGGRKRVAHEFVTSSTLQLAKELRNMCPKGRNLSIVLTLLEDVRMRANAAIACDWDEESDAEWQLVADRLNHPE